MTTQPGTSSASIDIHVPHSQNTAPVLEFRCLYTPDIRRKQKRWQDGRLKFHTFNKRVMVYDEKSNFVGDTHWKGGIDFEEGEELELERGGILVEVGECIGKRDQDLTELVDKRVKEREERVAAKVAASPSASLYRGQSTPAGSGLLRPKPLNAMLTPTGHYGRAVMPTTPPFEERQSTRRDENEPLAKKRRMNDTTASRNGFAQNLMGATLSLGSSKPSSTPTIRYEPFKARPVQSSCLEAIDLTLDDDEERKASDARRKLAQEQRAAIERPPPRQKKTKRSPPAKSGYASNLTGTPLMLSRSETRPSAKEKLSGAGILLHDLESDSTDLEGERRKASDTRRKIAQEQRAAIERPPPRQKRTRRSPPAKSGYASNLTGTPLMLNHSGGRSLAKPMMAKAPIQQYDLESGSSSSELETSVHVEPAPKPAVQQLQRDHTEPLSEAEESFMGTSSPPKVTKTVRKPKAPSPQPRALFEEDSPAEDVYEPPPGSIATKPSKNPKEAAAQKRPSKQGSSVIDLDPSPKRPPMKRKKESLAEKAPRSSRATPNVQSQSSPPPHSNNATPDIRHGGSLNKSAIQKSSAIEQPDRPRSALRIKSRPARQMMMLMSRPSSRPAASNTSFGSSRPNARAEPKSVDASNANEVEPSQATIKLDAFYETQQAKLEARLRGIESQVSVKNVAEIVNTEEDGVSDTGIDHQMIDMLSTRKSVAMQRQVEPVRRVSLKSCVVERPQIPAKTVEETARKTAMTSSKSSSPDMSDKPSLSKEFGSSPGAMPVISQHDDEVQRPSQEIPPVSREPTWKGTRSVPAIASHDQGDASPVTQSTNETTAVTYEPSKRLLQVGTAEPASLIEQALPPEAERSEKLPIAEVMKLTPEKGENNVATASKSVLENQPKKADAKIQNQAFPPATAIESQPPASAQPNFINTTSPPAFKELNHTTPNKPATHKIDHFSISKTPQANALELATTPGSSMQSSTARFRAMISPSSNTVNIPSIFGSPSKQPLEADPPSPPRIAPPPKQTAISHLKSSFSSEEPIERQRETREAVLDKPAAVSKSFSSIEGALHNIPGPTPEAGFSSAVAGLTACRSLSLSTPDLAAADNFITPGVRLGMGMGIGAPRPRLANPATRGKPLHTVAASTFDSIGMIGSMGSNFSAMPPPPSVVKSAGLLRIEREREMEGERERNEKLPDAPADGPWSREAWDLFGWHGPGVTT